MSVVLTAQLAVLSIAVLVILWPVSALADPPIVGSTTPTTAPAVVVKAETFTVSLRVKRREMHRLQQEIRQHLSSADKWALIRRGTAVVQPVSRQLSAMSLPVLRRQLHEAEKLDNRQRLQTQHPPHMSDWMCIHHYEGSWQDSGGPYWGGLQMSQSFQQHYGGWLYRTKGTADHWTPLEQIWTAERALRTRGFWPWPNTARVCGLL